MTDRKIYLPILTLVIGLLFLFIFGDYQDSRRFINVLAVLMILNSILILPYRLSAKYFDSDSKFILIFLVGLICITGGLIFSLLKYNDYRLEKNSTITKAIVIDKRWLGEKSGGYQIIYSFKAHQKEVKSRKMTSNYEVGDTIVIKYSNERPEHNELMKKN